MPFDWVLLITSKFNFISLSTKLKIIGTMVLYILIIISRKYIKHKYYVYTSRCIFTIYDSMVLIDVRRKFVNIIYCSFENGIHINTVYIYLGINHLRIPR